MSNKRIIGISIVISILLIAYRYLTESGVINVGNYYSPTVKFTQAYDTLKNSGKNQDLVQPWSGLDSIPDGEDILEDIEISGSSVAVKVGTTYKKGSWGDIAQWMRLTFNYPDAYDKLHREVFAWYKGVNIQPTGFTMYIYKFEIDTYLNSSSVGDVDNVEIGEFI